MSNGCASLHPNIFELRRNLWRVGEVTGPNHYPMSQPSFLYMSLAAITSPLPLTAATTASLAILNVTKLLMIPRSHVTGWGCPVWLVLDPRWIRNIFTDMQFLKYSSCNWRIRLDTYMHGHGRAMQTLYLGITASLVTASCTGVSAHSFICWSCMHGFEIWSFSCNYCMHRFWLILAAEDVLTSRRGLFMRSFSWSRLPLLLGYVFERDQPLQDSCRMSCGCFSSWDAG